MDSALLPLLLSTVRDGSDQQLSSVAIWKAFGSTGQGECSFCKAGRVAELQQDGRLYEL